MLLLSIVVILLSFILNIPVALSLMAGVLVYFLTNDSVAPMIMVQKLIAGVESFPLLAIPFFIFAGALMNTTGITRRLAKFAELVTGRLPGGLAQVNVFLSLLMGGLSGSNIADAAMQTKLLYPEMRKAGYSEGFSTAAIAASSLITPLIPPGIAMILFGFIGNVSIGKLFMAGIVPGLLCCIFLMVTVHILSKKYGYKPIRTTKVKPREVVIASKDAILALLLPVIIIGGIRIGMFSPSEAGAIAVLYALLIGWFYREAKLKDLKEPVVETVITTTSVLLIIAAGSALGWILTFERIPHMATEWMTGIIDSKLAFLIIINIFLLILGMFMEGNVLIIILTPLLLPMAIAFGIDPVHFGMIFLFNLFIGTLTPPLGTVMYTTCSIAGVKVEKFVKAMVPFYITLLILLILITYVPLISLWLPNMLM